ncbi:uncharacterized protein LOC111021029 [Momordica charantia]|uniref:Uncharacterized protein LOC111021029 n=1 Tax=Momordica charantia TaxID=3673 RepID=A0A6J1DHS7_MOMCH|nr:uncharacterized protein LOC111021029 [Momordica charantia]
MEEFNAELKNISDEIHERVIEELNIELKKIRDEIQEQVMEVQNVELKKMRQDIDNIQKQVMKILNVLKNIVTVGGTSQPNNLVEPYNNSSPRVDPPLCQSKEGFPQHSSSHDAQLSKKGQQVPTNCQVEFTFKDEQTPKVNYSDNLKGEEKENVTQRWGKAIEQLPVPLINKEPHPKMNKSSIKRKNKVLAVVSKRKRKYQQGFVAYSPSTVPINSMTLQDDPQTLPNNHSSRRQLKRESFHSIPTSYTELLSQLFQGNL